MRNQFEYIRYVYNWNEEIEKKFEKYNADPHNTANRWLRNGIPSLIFNIFDTNQNLLDSPYLFDICYNNLKNNLCLCSNEKLSKTVYDIIFHSETDVYETFKWDEYVQDQFKHIYMSYDSVRVLSSLLIYAQTGKIYSPNNVIQLKNNFSFAKIYKKDTITHSFDLLIEGATEVNMSQISVPSLIESYKEFYKGINKDSIMKMLLSNPRFKLNVLMIDPTLPNIETLLSAYMYGDSFSDNVKVVKDSICFAYELTRKFPKQVKAKVVSVPMSYSYMYVKKIEQPSIIKIDIYTPFNNADDRFSILIDDLENKEAFNYYSKTFYRMFHDGRSITEDMII